MSRELAKAESHSLSVFSNAANFEHAQRIAKMLCTSSLVPNEYQNNMSNTLVALEMANRVGASPLMVMQNLNVINGRPSWSSPFIIASINSCGRFAPLKFRFEDRGMKGVQHEYWTGSKANNDRRKVSGTVQVRDMACQAWTTDSSGEVLEGPWVSIEMAVLEGWYTKSDSKWKTMPEVMLRYRSAAFFGRLYCPEIMLGMHTSEEALDMTPAPTKTEDAVAVVNSTVVHQPTPTVPQPTDNNAVNELNARLQAQPSTSTPVDSDQKGTTPVLPQQDGEKPAARRTPRTKQPSAQETTESAAAHSGEASQETEEELV